MTMSKLRHNVRLGSNSRDVVARRLPRLWDGRRQVQVQVQVQRGRAELACCSNGHLVAGRESTSATSPARRAGPEDRYQTTREKWRDTSQPQWGCEAASGGLPVRRRRRHASRLAGTPHSTWRGPGTWPVPSCKQMFRDAVCRTSTMAATWQCVEAESSQVATTSRRTPITLPLAPPARNL
jgi:hypothetical protein